MNDDTFAINDREMQSQNLSRHDVTQLAHSYLSIRQTSLDVLIPTLSLLSEVPIECDALSVRTANCLTSRDIWKWGDLLDLTITDLLGIRNMGVGSVLDLLKLAIRRSRTTDTPSSEPPTSRVLNLPVACEHEVRTLVKLLSQNRHTRLRELLPSLLCVSDWDIDQKPLSVRARTCLSKREIQTWGDFIGLTVNDLFAIKGVGDTTVQDLLQLAARLSLTVSLSDAVLDSHSDSPISPCSDGAQEGREPDVPPRMMQAIKHLSRWAASERSADTLGDVCDLCVNSDLPSDIVKDWNAIKSIPVDCLVGNVTTEDVGRLIEECLQLLNERDREVFVARLPLLARPTLDELAHQLQLTRERVRQLEHRAATRMKTLVARRQYTSICWRASSMRTALGLGVPHQGTYYSSVITRALRGIGRELHDVSIDVLLWLAGPYKLESRSGWIVRSPLPTNSIMKRVVDKRRVVDLERLDRILGELGLVTSVRSDWIDEIGSIRTFEDVPVWWTGSVPDKALMLLECWRRPVSFRQVCMNW